MKNTRKLICVLLAAAMIILSAVPAFAEIDVDTKTKTFYMGNKDNTSGWSTSISIYGLEKNSKITDVKSSKKEVASIRSISHTETESFDPDEKSSSYYAYIYIGINKPGSATISFKVDGKAYKKKYNVVGYINPVKNFQLTGFNTKNLKSKFATGNSASENMTADAKAGYLTVAAASGWKIKNLTWYDRSDWSRRSYEFGGNGVNAAQLPTPAMKKSGSYYVYAYMVNTKTGGELYIYYYLNAASSNRR